MTKTTEEQILQKLNEVKEDVAEIKKSLPKTDIVTNEEYCRIRTANGAKLGITGLRKWFEKPGFPRVDSRHVSISAVNKWVEEKHTRVHKKE